MKLRTVSATRYVTPLREGGSLPAIVEADDSNVDRTARNANMPGRMASIAGPGGFGLHGPAAAIERLMESMVRTRS